MHEEMNQHTKHRRQTLKDAADGLMARADHLLHHNVARDIQACS